VSAAVKPAGASDGRPVAIGLAGPTASGKSAAALAIASVLPVEVISVDSALVYRGMDIGTAKPSADERASIPHHLIDILDPTQAYSAAQFAGDAARLVEQVKARGKTPLLVGGTMLYFKALIDGLDALPAANPGLRAQIAAQAAQLGWPAMHEQLSHVDPITASRLQPADAQRIQRALEVFQLTGQPLSQWHRREPRSPASLPILSLEPLERSWLHEHIERRFREMLAAGLVDEVQALRARGDLHLGLPSMRCVGYRQVWEALEAGTLATVAERCVAATRQLAKRQLTWLRSMPRRHVVACDKSDAIELVVAAALDLSRR
jgi:tRNA dimethylallyltransferase